jgi:hypothetical protein
VARRPHRLEHGLHVFFSDVQQALPSEERIGAWERRLTGAEGGIYRPYTLGMV